MCCQTICPTVYTTQGELCAIATCDEGLIVLRESEFELLDNDTLLFHNEAFEIAGYIDSLPIICSHISQNGTVQQIYYPPFISVLTYVGWSFSVVGSVVTLVIFSLLFKASRAQAKLKKQQNVNYLRVSLSVFSITGLTWIFAFLVIVVTDDWAWYAFVILTSTQNGWCQRVLKTGRLTKTMRY